MLGGMKARLEIKVDRRYRRSTRLQYKRKISAALDLLGHATFSPEAMKILSLLNEIRICAGLGSGMKVESGVFYIGRGLIEKSSREYLASSILHDCYHIHQFQNQIDGYRAWFKRGRMSARDHANNERGALRFQLEWAKAVGLSAYETAYLAGLLRDPKYQRVAQRKRDW